MKKLCKIFFCLLLSGCYSTQQAFEQMRLWNRQEPIPEVLAKPETEPQTKNKLQLVEKVLAYARNVDLNVGKSYQTYIAIDRAAVSYTVQAAYVDRLEAKTWWFPFVGRVPYLGFFAKEERDAEADDLERQGFDIAKGSVTAFSSLGWFNDPIYSSMLRRSDEDLAHLIFHELTHRTAWVKSSTEFNETLAEYVGEILSKKFFADTEGKDISLLQAERMQDDKLFSTWILELTDTLKNLYQRRKEMPRQELLSAKEKIFAQFTKEKKPTFKKWDYVGKNEWNNARVLGAKLYMPDMQKFNTAFRCFSPTELGKALRQLAVAADELSDVEKALTSLCGEVSA